MYREHPPPRSLADLVECFWQRRATDREPPSGVVLPDGRVDLVWVEGGGALVAGPARRSLPRPLTPPFRVVGARFHPGVAPALLGIPAHELTDLHVSLESIDSRPATALSARLGGAAHGDAAVLAIAEAIGSLTEGRPGPDRLVRAAAARLQLPRATTRAAAREVGLSERQLQRRFQDSVGYGPKTLQRVLRFQRFLAELRRARGLSEGLAAAAAAAASGYADQAHLTRETRRLADLTPGGLVRAGLV